MPDEICPVCGQPYIKKREFTAVIVYDHIPPIPSCEQRLTMPHNPNKAESTQSDVLRRKLALKSKRVRR
jgi:hypothetical protein